MNCHRQLKGVESSNSLLGAMHGDTRPGELKMNVLELRGNENPSLVQIRPQPVLSDNPARLIELVRSHFYSKNRFYFNKSKGRDDQPILFPTLEQPLHGI